MEVPELYAADCEDPVYVPLIGGRFDGAEVMIPFDADELELRRPIYLPLRAKRYAKYQIVWESSGFKARGGEEITLAEKVADEVRVEFRIPKKGENNATK
ncbi:hypothetical protein GYB59_14410 [bacterium]|nr:hypothetical protein [bacterium]